MKYAFFIASLPVPDPEDPPMTLAEFDALAEAALTPEDFARLRRFQRWFVPEDADTNDDAETAPPAVFLKMARFEAGLRSAIARRRAVLTGLPLNDVPEFPEYFSEVESGVTEAAAAPNPVERERRLDQLRLAYLDELSLLHDFDLDQVCIYRMRLFLANKYRYHQTDRGQQNFEAAARRISQATTN